MRFFRHIFYALLILPLFSDAQEILEQPEARLLTRFPFRQYSGGIMIVRACVDPVKDSFNFILDTGSGGISLDSSTCSNYGIESRQSDTSITGIAGVKKYPLFLTGH